jgi:hypothetical protein
MEPELPPGLDIELLLKDASTALLDGEHRDHIIERFQQLGIDTDIAAAIVDVCVPPFEVGGGDPQVIGTEYRVMGVPVYFEKDASYARKERRAAKRQRQEKIVRTLLREKLGTNQELDFGPDDAADSQPHTRWRGTRLRSLVVVLAVTIFAVLAIAALLAGAWLISHF